jgi:hypothetical protein
MATKPIKQQVGLGEFFELAGRSIAEAQDAIAPLDQPTQMVIDNAEVEVKVTVASDANGALAVQTISSEEASRGRIDPGMLSTLRVNFVAAAAEQPTTSVTGARPKRDVKDVIKEVSSRPDVVNVTKALGKLDFEAIYVPNLKRWLVIARDAKRRIVRESVVPDVAGEGSIG